MQVMDALLRREQELRLSAAAQQAVASPFIGSVTVTPPRSSIPMTPLRVRLPAPLRIASLYSCATCCISYSRPYILGS